MRERLQRLIRNSGIVSLFLLAFIFFLLDWLIFGVLIWKLPNESAWGTNYFYNFEYQFRKLEKRNPTKPLVLLLGSSIAAYSLDPISIRKKLWDKGIDADVEILSFAGMTPLDVYAFRERLEALKPKLVVYPINFIDFRVHREMQLGRDILSSEELDRIFLLEDSLQYGQAPQSRDFYPGEALLLFSEILSPERLAEYALAYWFKFYKYRDLYWDNLRNVYQHRWGRNTSYHGYCGVQIPERVDALGWTKGSFSFIVSEFHKKNGFYIQLVPELIQNPDFQIGLYSDLGRLLQEIRFSSPGWKKISLDPNILSGMKITVQLSHTWQPFDAQEDRFDYSREEMGVRLTQIFGREGDYCIDCFLYREERKEDLRIAEMKDSEYKEYYNFKFYKDSEKRPGLSYFQSILNAKKWAASRKFIPNPQYQSLRKWREYFGEREIEWILVNNPENPINLQLYLDSDWYREQLNFLHDLEGGRVHFFDWKDNLSMQSFLDFHHFTYPAMVSMSEKYAQLIEGVWKNEKKDQK